MKTTIEISDNIYRQIKAIASLRGQTMKSYFMAALKEKLQREAETNKGQPGWLKTYGKIDPTEMEEIQAIIDAEFSKIELWDLE